MIPSRFSKRWRDAREGVNFNPYLSEWMEEKGLRGSDGLSFSKKWMKNGKTNETTTNEGHESNQIVLGLRYDLRFLPGTVAAAPEKNRPSEYDAKGNSAARRINGIGSFSQRLRMKYTSAPGKPRLFTKSSCSGWL